MAGQQRRTILFAVVGVTVVWALALGGYQVAKQLWVTQELEAKVRTVGLKTFYSESSAETKAELAPLLNELQLQMETNPQFRRGGN